MYIKSSTNTFTNWGNISQETTHKIQNNQYILKMSDNVQNKITSHNFSFQLKTVRP